MDGYSTKYNDEDMRCVNGNMNEELWKRSNDIRSKWWKLWSESNNSDIGMMYEGMKLKYK